VKPASLSVLTVRKTCSMQGLKQQIRVKRSFYAYMREPGGRHAKLGRTHPERRFRIFDGVPRSG